MVYKAAMVRTETLLEEALDQVNKVFPSNYSMLKQHPLSTWTNCATPRNHVVLDPNTSNVAESVINVIGPDVSTWKT